MSGRLIDRPDARTQLLAAIAAVPAGERLNIAALRNALVDQADVLRAIEDMIAQGKIDARTMRPVVRLARRATAKPLAAGDGLLAEIEAFLQRSGMAATSFSKRAVGSLVLVSDLRAGRRCGPKVSARVRAFIANHETPPECDAGEGGVAPVATAIERAADETGAADRADPAAPVEAMPEPPLAVAPPPPPPPLPAPVAVADAAPPAPRALTDSATFAQRQAAAVRRGHAREAAKIVAREAAGEVVAGLSPAIRAAANAIKDQQAAAARATDPVERAKLALQRKGHRVFAASVSGGPEGHFYVGTVLVDAVGLLQRAGLEHLLPGTPGRALKPSGGTGAAKRAAPAPLKPAEMGWCEQCDRRVSGAAVGKCESSFCPWKRSAS